MAAIRFLWCATRGNRLRPWRSEYLRWRIETYSGQAAASVDAAVFFRFLWNEKMSILRFLLWIEDFDRRVRRA